MLLLNAKQAVNAIKHVGHKRTIIIQGENGVGKSAVFHTLRKDPHFANHVAVGLDCTQMSDGSVWMPDIDREQGVSRELPNERFGVSNVASMAQDPRLYSLTRLPRLSSTSKTC